MRFHLASLALVAAFAAGSVGIAQEPDAFGKVAKLKTMTMEEVTAKVSPWLETLPAQAKEEAAKALGKEPAPATGPELLVRLGEVFAAGDLRARELLDTISRPLDPTKLPDAK